MSHSTLSVTEITGDHAPRAALMDLWNGFKQYDLWSRFAVHDIRQRFRRSVLGPFWLTLSMGIMVGALGLVFGQLFQQEIRETLPYIATGLIFWGLLTSCISEGTTVFVGNQGFIRNVPMPLSTHVYRMIARNIIIWCFNMAIYFVVLLYFGINPGWNAVLFIPGLIFFAVNMSWMAFVAGILSTRYRDIPQVILNFIQVVFFVTPVFWSIDALPTRPAFVHFNPMYHLLEVVRAPLLGEIPTAENWISVCVLTIVGVTFTAYLYRRAYARIAYWV